VSRLTKSVLLALALLGAGLLAGKPDRVPFIRGRSILTPSAPVCRGITLHLHPGISFGGTQEPRWHVDPAPDIPTRPLTLTIPLYPAARRSSVRLVHPWLQYPGTQYLQSAIVEVRAPAGQSLTLFFLNRLSTELSDQPLIAALSCRRMSATCGLPDGGRRP
jgi:hypothetical protein